MAKKKYQIRASVESASGYQQWTVMADSPEEARRLHDAGASTFDHEEVEVTGLGETEVFEEE